MRKIKCIILIIVAVLLLVSPCVNAEYVADQKETLRGIKRIGVVIKGLSRKIKKLGITGDKLRTDVELKLRMAGIDVVTQEEFHTNLEIPYLEVTIIPGYSKPAFVYAILVGLYEKVHLKREPKIISYAIPWWRIMVQENIEEIEMEKSVRNMLKFMIDEFTKDYLAVNPKQARKPQGGK